MATHEKRPRHNRDTGTAASGGNPACATKSTTAAEPSRKRRKVGESSSSPFPRATAVAATTAAKNNTNRNQAAHVAAAATASSNGGHSTRTTAAANSTVCPYLDTVNRKVLDFDFEKICSVSLASRNVYCCLVCGRYYQGRGRHTYAHMHALEAAHHLFLNLETRECYCLPDGYVVRDASIEDVKFNLHPTFSPNEVVALTRNKQYMRAFDGTAYLPGMIGLNNIKHNDYVNAMVLALSRVSLLRRFFLVESNVPTDAPLIVRRFGELLAKMWNPRRFTAHVSPHELLQAVATSSGGLFPVGVRQNAMHFLRWFINQLHRGLGGTAKRSSLISKAFQGQVRVETIAASGSGEGGADAGSAGTPKVTYRNFFYLSLDLPQSPLFRDGSTDSSMLPQVSILQLLAKFDGKTEHSVTTAETDVATPAASAADTVLKARYSLSRLPRFLVVHAKRFVKNNYFMEKNPTLVNFPLSKLDLRQFVHQPEPPTMDALCALSVAELKRRCRKLGVDVTGVVEKVGVASRVLAATMAKNEKKGAASTKYDLIANVCHEGKADSGLYHCHLFHRPTNAWFEARDLAVQTSETMAQLVQLSEMYIQIYERCD